MEEQLEELEVLRSIYNGDTNFTEVSPNTFQYRVGESEHYKSFLLEIVWPDNYPVEKCAEVNLNSFYNRRLLPVVQETILGALRELADSSLGMPATFALINLAVENQEAWTEQQTEGVIHLNKQDPFSNDSKSAPTDMKTQQKSEINKAHISKATKRKMWDRGEISGERPRGWNWVDIVKHLSQTGVSQQV